MYDAGRVQEAVSDNVVQFQDHLIYTRDTTGIVILRFRTEDVLDGHFTLMLRLRLDVLVLVGQYLQYALAHRCLLDTSSLRSVLLDHFEGLLPVDHWVSAIDGST